VKRVRKSPPNEPDTNAANRKPSPEWHARFIKELPPDVNVWISLCDLTRISTSIWVYISDSKEEANSRRRFASSLQSDLGSALGALESAYETSKRRGGNVPSEIQNAIANVQGLLKKLAPLTNLRRLGVNSPVWVLIHLEAYIEKNVGRKPTIGILSALVRAGRLAASQAVTSWDSAEVLGKNLRNFKKRQENQHFLEALSSPQYRF
jgi:hypothetical protein